MSNFENAMTGPHPKCKCNRADRLLPGLSDMIRDHFDEQEKLRRLREKERIMADFFKHSKHE